MSSTTAIANPFSYSQSFRAFWPAACTTRRTACGTQLLVGFDVRRSVPNGFVAEHRAKCRPGRIERRLSLRSIRQGSGFHIADDNQLVFLHECHRLLMQKILSRVGDLRVDCLSAFLVTSALCRCQRSFIFLKLLRVLDLATVGQCSQRAQAEIDADFTRAAVLFLDDFELHIEIPSSARVLRKRSAFDFAIDRTAIPKPIVAFEIDHGVAVDLDGASGSKWNPAERLLSTPARPPLGRIAAHRKLPTDGIHSVAVQAEQRARSGGELDQVEGRRPRLVVSTRRFLDFAAVIPDAIDGAGQGREPLARRGIFDPVAIGEDHQGHYSAPPPRPSSAEIPDDPVVWE